MNTNKEKRLLLNKLRRRFTKCIKDMNQVCADSGVEANILFAGVFYNIDANTAVFDKPLIGSTGTLRGLAEDDVFEETVKKYDRCIRENDAKSKEKV